ncbi:MAG: extensin family protein [Devosiaceae bacterium]|nr:extensin family protein [Devosiaceae bacterium MH13]
MIFNQPSPINGPGACGIPAPVKVTSIGGIALRPTATLTCPTALAFAQFLRGEIAPAARAIHGAPPATVHVAASYVCRTRNHQPGARMSEHSFGRAIDVRAITLASGRQWSVAPRSGGSADARFQARVRQAACGPFRTVLGPGSDGFHTDHLHFDLAERRSTYCR